MINSKNLQKSQESSQAIPSKDPASDLLYLFSTADKSHQGSRALTNLVKKVRDLGLPADGVFLNSYLKNDGIIRFYARATDKDEITTPLDIAVPPHLRKELEKQERPSTLVVNKIEEDPVTLSAAGTAIPGIRSYIMMKLSFDGHHFGVIAFWSRKENSFTDDNARLLSSLAAPLAAWASQTYLQSLKQENALLRSQLALQNMGAINTLLANSPGLKDVSEKVLKIAGTPVTVLINGESGVGKEVIARTIVEVSDRRKAPFVVVNCGAIPESLIESELFGFEKGAFTGAVSRRAGFFEQADGGTLFLDEVGELPLFAQVKLLRAIQQKAFHRIGGEHSIKVDVRIIAATNRDLAGAVQNGSFREDLFYRLNVFPITIPPLRERPGDILTLADLFIRRFAKKYTIGAVPRLSQRAKEEALKYTWPGNVRELENASERAVLLYGNEIDSFVPSLTSSSKDTPKDSSGTASLTAPSRAAAPSPKEANNSVRDFLKTLTFEELEKIYFSILLQSTSGRISGPHGAAKIAGLNANTFRSKLQKLGILFSNKTGNE